MANVPIVFMLQFLLVVTIQVQSKQSNYTISLNSSIFPSTHPTSWQSPSGHFSFGFYRQGNGFMVGIWLGGKQNITVVWTANRGDAPISSDSKLEFTRDGELNLTANHVVKNLVADPSASATSAAMLDSGNFVLYNGTNVIWESFSLPTDTILGGQNLTTSQILESSQSTTNHSVGRFYLAIQTSGNLVAYAQNSFESAYWSTAPFGRPSITRLNLNSSGYLCLQDYQTTCLHTLAISNNSYTRINTTVIYRATLDPDGIFRLYSHRFNSIDNYPLVSMDWSALQNPCQSKGFCGYNSFCNSSAKVEGDYCICYPGFAYVNPDMKFQGCYRTFSDEQACKVIDQTMSYNITMLNNIDWSGYAYYMEEHDKQENCAQSCREDCNCWAAQFYNDMTCRRYKLPLQYGVLNKSSSTIAFIKMSFPKKNDPEDPNVVVITKKTPFFVLALSLGSLAVLCTIIAVLSFFFYRSRSLKYQKLSMNASLGLNGDYTLRSFTYSELEKATYGFKDELGRNLYGAVYKGVLFENQIITVKRLERIVEGERGFRAEMTAIGQTHHRNLVRLLGFCIEGAKKLLVYEFLNNGSLADLLFKSEIRPKWNERVRIALDVARGILYLHEECKVRIVHCNIKPQNILMDDSWTAKISDFGLAKLLMPNQSINFTGVRGTGGYLAPEWHKNSPISEKVDIYSFGVVLFEILCCRSNIELNVPSADEVTLTTWVYDCFAAKQLNSLIADDEDVNIRTFERMVKVGLLCIQDNPNLRPAIKSVILMLQGTMDVPIPPSPTPVLVVI